MSGRKRIAVVYGSGSSFDSGYEVQVVPPKYGGWVTDPKTIPPPCDRDFFSNGVAWNVARRYSSITLFVQKYFGFTFEEPCSLGLEEVWSAVDLNHRHIRLETYSWESETNEYLRSGLQNLYEDRDLQDTRPDLKDPGSNPFGGNEVKFFGDCGRHLRHLVYRVYGSPVLKQETKDNFARLHHFLSEQEFDVEYITFNYDSCLERSLKRSGFEFDYLPDVTSPSGGLFRPKFSHVLKLHGSLTWTHRWSAVQPITLDPTFAPWDSRGDALNFIAIKPDYNRVGYFQPAIIPPTWFKQQINDTAYAEERLSQLILHQWRAALLALQLADTVVIVGYSFPSSDFHVHRLFGLAVMLRGEQKTLPLVYCTADEDEEALGRLKFLPKDRVRIIRPPTPGFSQFCEEENLSKYLSEALR